MYRRQRVETMSSNIGRTILLLFIRRTMRWLMHRYTLSYFVDSIVVLLLFACLLYSQEYDKCGRVRRITHDYDKIEEQTYSYYSSGRLQEVVNEHAQGSFHYNSLG